ncbi:MAG: type I-E CRISPR-associated protein Cse1/CasA [bacterium]
MNLLIDPWIPVLHQGRFQHVTLKDVLCQDADWQLCSFRDDMELAALQLVICLVQVIFPPDSHKEVRQRLATPMDEEEFSLRVSKYLDMFVLDHPKHPFMQTRGVKAKESTPMQKLFIGYDRSFFNDPDEISRACPACVAVALFNQASNCPSFGGGFKGSLRGSAPLTTLVYGESLRSTIWRNILSRNTGDQQSMSSLDGNNQPGWVDQIKSQEVIYPHKIGLLRGLFWQPAHVEVEWQNSKSQCQACNQVTHKLAIGFKKEKFKYEIQGIWLHPHSPREWKLAKGTREEKYASFTTTAPAWTQLNTFLTEREIGSAKAGQPAKAGYVPSAVVSQFRKVFFGEEINLIVGGYRVNQASVLQRRHEMFNLPAGWTENMDKVEELIALGLKVKDELRKKLFGFAKKVHVPGLPSQAEERFYQSSEPLIHKTLRTMKWQEGERIKADLLEQLSSLARQIFEEVTQSYRHDPKMIRAFALSRRSLNSALNKLSIS